MSAAFNSFAELPMWTKPAPKASRQPEQGGDFQIPLWVKPTGVENIQDHLSVVLPHQIEAAKSLAVKREAASVPLPMRVTDAVDYEVSSSGSTSARGEGTEFQYSDDELEALAITQARIFEDDACPFEVGDLHSVQSSVASLRDARIRANSRRTLLGCAAAGVADGNGLHNLESLITSLRDARNRASSRRAVLGCAIAGVAEEEDLHNSESPVASLRHARIRANSRRAALACATAALTGIDNGSRWEGSSFSITVSTMNGNCHDISGLYSNMPANELCAIVAERLEIPVFAVYLVWGSQALHASMVPTSLGLLDIREGSQLTLAKDFGWAKPDLTLLTGLEKQWQGREHNVLL
jgi:hypothetical protein